MTLSLVPGALLYAFTACGHSFKRVYEVIFIYVYALVR